MAWQWNPMICAMLGPHVLRPATLTEDRLEGTDLRLYVTSGLRIAVRVRTPNASRFLGDITFTTKRESGALCEWDKVIEGEWGDWFFYGHSTNQTASETGARIAPAYLLDLSLVRRAMKSFGRRYTGRNQDTGPGCWFGAYGVQEIVSIVGAQVVIAQWSK